MKKILFRAAMALIILSGRVEAQQGSVIKYEVNTVMIPMRDGIKLFTSVVTPVDLNQPVPILIQRTPYSATLQENYDPTHVPYISGMAKEGYIFVFQDIRGKFKSEGKMEIHQPLSHLSEKGAIDESTDTWDTIDWLIKNIRGNNGRVGILGSSYPGWLALVGSVDHHPALKAACEQACMSDLFLGDDFHHNGAFRLSYGMEYSYEIEHAPATNSDFPFPQFDLFDWYLKLGSLKNVNERYFHNLIPSWNHFVEHPNYDSFWQRNSTLGYVQIPEIPILHVGGYFDQEDLNGPQLMYNHLEKKDSFHRNYIILGPWYHSQWRSEGGESLGRIQWGSRTVDYFQELQRKWFDHWLKPAGEDNGSKNLNTSPQSGHSSLESKFPEATSFQTGANQWKTYSSWPPKEMTVMKLYAGPGNTCSFSKPLSMSGQVSYMSDPQKPVPYRTLPIEATYGRGSRWRTWQAEDQRFVYTRPDVVSFVMDSLSDDLIVTGKVIAHLFASTTGTDADWIVKLIDVYPDFEPADLTMSGYQLPVAMEVFRGRFRKSFSNPSPLIPNKPEEFVIDMHDINHLFKKGHRVMIQVQSSWFPVIDRNPQKFVPNIFKAGEKDFIKATHTIYYNARYPTYIDLPVIK